MIVLGLATIPTLTGSQDEQQLAMRALNAVAVKTQVRVVLSNRSLAAFRDLLSQQVDRNLEGGDG